jgi:hypothetical protein
LTVVCVKMRSLKLVNLTIPVVKWIYGPLKRFYGGLFVNNPINVTYCFAIDCIASDSSSLQFIRNFGHSLGKWRNQDTVGSHQNDSIAPVAQWIEHTPPKSGVTRSIRVRGTKQLQCVYRRTHSIPRIPEAQIR